MNENVAENSNSMPKLPAIAAAAALIGLADSIYLTVQHITAAPVPCSIISGCETVLTSPYAVMAGIPIAAFGAGAYFVAFALALLAAFGNRTAWHGFCVMSVGMAAFTVWLLYLQGFVIGAFCQFCLLSAVTSLTLFAIAVLSKPWRRNG